ncbi:MAG: glycosyltransferase family 2 protein [Candidatus Shapirobacteria bacterium]|jgi:glycosyltransferase involved in cell wall biosynthesis
MIKPTSAKLPELSVFFLCYNEEANIENTFNRALPFIKQVAQRFEVLIVNDGSKDKSALVLEKIKKKYPKIVRIVTHPVNRGYGAAFKSGLYNSRYQWIAFTDGDGQFDFSEIKLLIAKQKKTHSDMVIGYYLARQVSPMVILTSKIWELIVFILYGLRVTDIDCGFKLISKKVADTIPDLEAERGAFVNSEFLIKAKKAGFKISEVGVHHYPRKEGKATGRQLKVILKSFSDLFKLWYKINFTRA